jgi:uncharacterized membrane protein YfcA
VTGALLAAVVGLGAGLLSGAFGVGGGVVTTPAIRLLLGYPELIAVGTPLPVIIPTAIAGAVVHARLGTADVRRGLLLGVWGAPSAVAGAMLTRLAGGQIVLIITAVVIVVVAIDMLRAASPAPEDRAGDLPPMTVGRTALLGAGTGAFSGFLGLGGGFVLVPLLCRVGGFPIKHAIGTSLVAVAVFAVPGSIAHWLLGNVDAGLALALVIGVVPGAIVGARFTLGAQDRTVRTAFAVLLIVVGVVLGLTEAGAV